MLNLHMKNLQILNVNTVVKNLHQFEDLKVIFINVIHKWRVKFVKNFYQIQQNLKDTMFLLTTKLVMFGYVKNVLKVPEVYFLSKLCMKNI